MPTDIKLSKAQVSKIIQSGESFSSWLDNLGKKAPANFAIPWATENLRGLVSNLTANAIKSLEKKKKKKKKSGKWVVRTGKGFTLFIFNEDTNDIIEIIKSLEDFRVSLEDYLLRWCYWNSKAWNKITRRWISWGYC